MENNEKIKIIFVVSEISITQMKGVNFKKALKNVVDMFEDINILKDSIALLVNKSTKKLETIKQQYIEKINEQIKDPKTKKLIEYLQNSTFIFE